MASNVKPRVKVPKTAKRGEVIEIKTLISHKMESGQRRDQDGAIIPRHIINRFVCTFNDETVFACDWHPAISANPYMAFRAVAHESGTFAFVWTDDDGSEYRTTASIDVT